MNIVKKWADVLPWAALGLSLVLFLGTGVMQLNSLDATSVSRKNADDIKVLTADVSSLTTAIQNDHEIVMELLKQDMNKRP